MFDVLVFGENKWDCWWWVVEVLVVPVGLVGELGRSIGKPKAPDDELFW